MNCKFYGKIKNNIFSFLFVNLAIVLLAACGSEFTGIYYYEDMFMGEKIVGKYEFKSDGKVYINSKMEGEKVLNFKKDNNKIIIGDDKDNVVLTIQSNGSLSGKAGILELNLVKADILPNNTALRELFENYLISTNKMNKFMYSKVLKIDNVKIIKTHDIYNINYYIEFNFDTIHRIDSNKFESNFTQDELKDAFGTVYKNDTYNKIVENIEKSGLKSGDKIKKPGNAALILENIKGKWSVKSITKPEESPGK